MEQQGQTHRPEEYKGIAAWGYWLGSQWYFIRNEQERAAREGAPLDALYRRAGDEGWCCASDLEERHRGQVERLMAEFGPRGHTPWKGVASGW